MYSTLFFKWIIKFCFFYYFNSFLNIKYNTDEITDGTLNTDKQSLSKSFRELEKNYKICHLRCNSLVV